MQERSQELEIIECIQSKAIQDRLQSVTIHSINIFTRPVNIDISYQSSDGIHHYHDHWSARTSIDRFDLCYN